MCIRDRYCTCIDRLVSLKTGGCLSFATNKHELPDRLVTLYRKHNQIRIKQMTAQYRGWWCTRVVQTSAVPATSAVFTSCLHSASLVAFLHN